MESSRIIVDRIVKLDNSHRRLELPQNIKMDYVERLTLEPTTRSPLDFKIKVDHSKIRDIKISTTGSICKIDGTRLGSFFSQEIHLDTDSIFLSILNHNLSSGNYYLNLSIATGSVVNDTLKEVDHAYEAIYFQISKENLEGKHITEWRSSWGNAYYECHLGNYAR